MNRPYFLLYKPTLKTSANLFARSSGYRRLCATICALGLLIVGNKKLQREQTQKVGSFNGRWERQLLQIFICSETLARKDEDKSYFDIASKPCKNVAVPCMNWKRLFLFQAQFHIGSSQTEPRGPPSPHPTAAAASPSSLQFFVSRPRQRAPRQVRRGRGRPLAPSEQAEGEVPPGHGG